MAVEQIIGYINENGLQPGDQLPNEVDLMNKLKVGRGTIREAIKSLNSKGVVIIKRGIGTFVADQQESVMIHWGLLLKLIKLKF